MNIILFGQLKELAGHASMTIDDVDDIDGLQRELRLKYPGLAAARYVVAVDRKIIQGNRTINNKNEIALLPPYSGG